MAGLEVEVAGVDELALQGAEKTAEMIDVEIARFENLLADRVQYCCHSLLLQFVANTHQQPNLVGCLGTRDQNDVI